MPVADIPAWTAITVAAMSMVGALVGSIGMALVNRNNLRDSLRQELLLHGAHDRTEALEKAIHVASDYRERAAAGLRLFDPNGNHGFSSEPLWGWDTQAVQDVKAQEGSLKLRFRPGPVTTRWEFFEWLLAEAAVFNEMNRSAVENSHRPIPSDLQEIAQHWRTATREALNSFSAAAGEALATVQLPPESVSRKKRWLKANDK